MGIALTEQDRLTYDTSNLRNLKEQEEADSGTQSTPPMWSPPRSTYNGTMSPNSRVQAIARGQRELMDMVSRMPEACYELSLKDMVDHQHRLTVVEAEQETTITNSKVVPRRDHQKDSKQKKKKKAVVMRSRSGSFDNGGGLFLKMVFPVSFGSTKKGRLRSNSKGRGSGCVVDGRVSPRPLLLGEGDGHGHSHSSTKKVEEDEEEEEEEEEGKESLGFSSSGKSESSKSTGVSSRSSSRNSTGQARFSCWSCIYSNKDKKKAT